MRPAHFSTALAIAAALTTVAGGQSTTPVSVVTAPGPLQAVVGTWEGSKPHQNGIGPTILLSSDSNFALVLGAIVDFKYKIDRNQITLISDEPGDEGSEKQTLTFDGGQPVISGNGCKRTLRRFGATVPDSGLVGTWTSTHMTGVPAYEEYTSDGRARMRVPINVQKGSFGLDGSKILFHTKSPRREDWSADFTVTGDTLTFSVAGESQTYVRARPLIPFEVQQPSKPSRLVCI